MPFTFTSNLNDDLGTAFYIANECLDHLEAATLGGEDWTADAMEFMDRFTDTYCPIDLLTERLISIEEARDLCETCQILGVL